MALSGAVADRVEEILDGWFGAFVESAQARAEFWERSAPVERSTMEPVWSDAGDLSFVFRPVTEEA